jgi:UDP-GlcNAc:undecaprenyl-phosphate GlcNAc-1-phosphate transferase
MIEIFIFVASLFSALLMVPLIRKVALHFRIGALPSARKIHKDFVPLLGGMGIFTGLVMGVLAANISGIMPFDTWISQKFFWLGLAVILLLGLIDDVRGVNAWQKFTGQFLAAGLAVLGGCSIEAFYSPGGGALELGWFAYPFSVLWIMFIINSVNLLDGLDGLASGISLIITGGILVIAMISGNIFLIVLAIALIGGILGFLRFNYHPAKIFMGDVGSLMLGYLLACFSVEALKVAKSHQVYFLVSLTLLGMPITDTLISFFRRMGRGDHPFKADREHIHHRLLKLGDSGGADGLLLGPRNRHHVVFSRFCLFNLLGLAPGVFGNPEIHYLRSPRTGNPGFSPASHSYLPHLASNCASIRGCFCDWSLVFTDGVVSSEIRGCPAAL